MAVVNETMARRFWPGEDPIGKRFSFDVVSGEQPRTVIGVVRDIAQLLDTSNPLSFTPLTSSRRSAIEAHSRIDSANDVRPRGPREPLTLVPDVRKAIAEVDPHGAVSNIIPGQAMPVK